MTQRLYTEMSADEQALWVQDFAQVLEQHGERLALLAKGKTATVPAGSPAGNVTTDDAAAVRRIFTLLAVWPFAQDFCEKAQRYGDYMARAPRLPIYIEKVKEKLADGLTMTDTTGRIVAYVNPSTPMRRRGRPTKEETAARLRGEALTATVPDRSRSGNTPDDPEARKRRTIAALLGLQVIVHGEPPREKNNAELAADRAARAAEEAKRNPSLFPAVATVPDASPAGSTAPALAAATVPDNSPAGVSPSPCAQLMSDSYEMRMAQDKLHLNQLAWMLSTDLAKRVETVQTLRVTAESASERAKTLADLGQPSDAIAPYAQQAKEATEAYLAIYAAVDNELAILHKRLYLDLPYVEKFKTRFKGVDIEKVLHITRPYYEKVKKDNPTIDERIRTIIEQGNPAYAAKMKAEEEKKHEVADILRYLKRKDKPNVAQRIKTMEARYDRLVELLGETEASVYRPIVNAAIEDYNANFKAKDEAKKKNTVPSDSVAGKKSAKQEKRKATKQQTEKQ